MNKFYLKEFQFFDGEDTVVFNIVALYEGSDKITVAVTKNGKITVTDYDQITRKEIQEYLFRIVEQGKNRTAQKVSNFSAPYLRLPWRTTISKIR